MNITSFEQAKRCLDDLREFLDFADSAISGVSALKGTQKQAQPELKLAERPAVRTPTNGSEPKGWTDGVRKILSTADKPLRAVDVLERWKGSGWSHPDERRKFYIGINGGIQYLLKKNFVEKADGKYKLKA